MQVQLSQVLKAYTARRDHEMQEYLQENDQVPDKPHELLPLLLVPLKLKGDCCNVAVLNASAACLALSQTLPAGAEEIVAADSHVTRILNAHIGLPVGLFLIAQSCVRDAVNYAFVEHAFKLVRLQTDLSGLHY